MIPLLLPAFAGTGLTRIFLACGATDMRKGFDGLAVMTQQDALIYPSCFRWFSDSMVRERDGGDDVGNVAFLILMRGTRRFRRRVIRWRSWAG